VIDLARSPAPRLQASSSQPAEASYAGEITDEELERERGGSGLRHSFDIKNGSASDEVGVDAKTGQVLENSGERGRR
jgi:uncharacterized membrane protein YkoI